MFHNEITEKILKACFQVSNELGCGFVESVYEKALLIALRDDDLVAVRQAPITVKFRKQDVGLFYADLLVEGNIIVELKATSSLLPEHIAQTINYLKATGKQVGLLINFGKPRLEYRRVNNKLDRS
ncbi:MAG: GxxExxY protein [Desulfuromonadales bacterium]|nr:GxxExxY protein [Desulfuromonadales bacterium]